MISRKEQIRCAGVEETHRFGRSVAQGLYPGLAILLFGDLGAGKTELVRALAAALEWHASRSPSFTLVNEYETTPPMAHADLYRLGNEDVPDLGLDEYLRDGYLLVVEWAERWDDAPGEDVWHVCIEPEDSEPGDRKIRIAAHGERAGAALDKTMAFWQGEGGKA